MYFKLFFFSVFLIAVGTILSYSKKEDGTQRVVFRMDDATFPVSWDDNDARIVANKYFFKPKKEDWKQKMVAAIVDITIMKTSRAGWFLPGFSLVFACHNSVAGGSIQKLIIR